MSEISPNDRYFGGVFLDETGLYCIYPDAGKKRIDEVVWYLKSRDAYEVVTVGYQDGTNNTIIHYLGDPIKTDPTKVVNWVQPQVFSGDVLRLRSAEFVSVVDKETLPDETLDTILQAILKKIVKITYIKQNEE